MNISSVQGQLPAASNLTSNNEEKVAKEFEAVFLTQFVDQVMKTAGSTAFGGEKQAEMWRSFMSEAVANHLVEQGGLGLAGQVSQMLSSYSRSKSEEQAP